MANRPVILIGAGCPHQLAEWLCTLGIPVLTTWQGIDRVPEDSPVFCGRPGVIGQRAANIIQQKASVLIIVGARLDMEQVGHRMDNFAPQARTVVYDVDRAELDKLPLEWLKVLCDLSGDLETIKTDIRGTVERATHSDILSRWLKWCRALYERFRPELDGPNVVEDYVNPYSFVRHLSYACREGEVIVPGSSGMQSCAMMQAFQVKRGQRILLCNTTGAMGLEPMAIGAAIGTGRRVVCVTGDGGFAFNMQELEVVARLKLPVKYFVFCNGGYGSITAIQDARFNMRVGSDAASGFTLPNVSRIAHIWDLPFHYLLNDAHLERIPAILDGPGPAVIEVHSSLAFRYACKVNSSLSGGVFVTDDMADMTPKLPRDEYKEIMEWGT